MLAVTGASGFLGRHTVAAALRRGVQVAALVRPATATERLPWRSHRLLEIRHAELENPEQLTAALTGAERVIHAAAPLTGSYRAQYAATVEGTERLLASIRALRIAKLVAVSSFSVYDYRALAPGSVLTEDSPLEQEPEERDTYARLKLLQEERVRAFAAESTTATDIMRPGVIYGPGRLWSARLGIKAGSRLWLIVGGDALLPLTYVENCADALVSAALSEAGDRILNVVDDDRLTQADYGRQIRSVMSPSPQMIALDRSAISAIARAISSSQKTLLKRRLQLPGILIPARLDARFKALEYSNQRLKARLNWQPRYGFVEALQRSQDGESAIFRDLMANEG